MVQINIVYEGKLHCSATHVPSGQTLGTDAPKDNQGQGETFSPTDLVATALGACMLTIMGIVAQRQNLNLTGSTVTVMKEMTSQPTRRIGRLPVTVTVPTKLSEDDRRRLENAVVTCPVHRSLHPEIEIPIAFKWGQ